MLRSAIFGLPEDAAAAEFANMDNDNEEDAAAAAEAEEEGAQVNRHERRQDKQRAEKERREAVCVAYCWEWADSEAADLEWTNPACDLKLFARQNHFLIDPLRKALITGDSTIVAHPKRGNHPPIRIRIVQLADAVAARCQAEMAAAAEAEQATAAEAEQAAAAEAEDKDGSSFDPMPDLVDDDSSSDGVGSGSDSDEVVTEIEAHKGINGAIKYLVVWACGSRTWEPARNLTGCGELLQEYNQREEQARSQANNKSAYEEQIERRRLRNARRILELGIQNMSVDEPPVPAPTPPAPAPLRVRHKSLPAKTPASNTTEPEGPAACHSGTTYEMPSLSPSAPSAGLPTSPPSPPQFGTQINAPYKNQQAPTPPPSAKRDTVSPAANSPPPESPTRRVRSSPRFQMLPGAAKPPTLKVGDKVTAIFMYKEGGTRKCLGTVASIDEDGQHFTIVYKDGDVEEHVSRAVITLMKSKLLDKSPEM